MCKGEERNDTSLPFHGCLCSLLVCTRLQWKPYYVSHCRYWIFVFTTRPAPSATKDKFCQNSREERDRGGLRTKARILQRNSISTISIPPDVNSVIKGHHYNRKGGNGNMRKGEREMKNEGERRRRNESIVGERDICTSVKSFFEGVAIVNAEP